MLGRLACARVGELLVVGFHVRLRVRQCVLDIDGGAQFAPALGVALRGDSLEAVALLKVLREVNAANSRADRQSV